MTRNIVNEHALIISRELDIMRKHVSATIRLLDDGATVPFIARYRKEATGSMDEVMIRKIQLRHQALTDIYHRRDTIIAALKQQGALTPELLATIEETIDPTVLEDIYLPYKPRRATRAQAARALGLEPLARMIMAQTGSDPATQARKFVTGDVADVDAAIAGARDIIAEWVSENAKARNLVRSRFQRSAVVTAKVVAGKEKEGENYSNYFDHSEPMRLCSSHRYLAIRRGENEGILKVSIGIDDREMVERLQRMFVRSSASEATAAVVADAVADGYRRLMRPSIENEMAAALKEKSDAQAIAMFADNARALLMASPLPHKRVMGIDPGFRSGCKVACLDEQGNLLAHDVIYPVAPHNDVYRAADILCHMVADFGIDAIALGSGTAGRETRRFLDKVEFPRRVAIYMVSEDGASVYSASEVARREFPDLDLTVRGAISIGRRLLDPLAELVKIDPKSIGVGQYQHDVNQSQLKDALDFTVESCVNTVGVNLNTSSAELLSYVSGIGPKLATNIVEYRAAHGDFTSRQQLLEVPRMGEKSFKQCAGFLRIPNAPNRLDNTAVHPERYELLATIASDMGLSLDELLSNRAKLHSIDLDHYATKEAGVPTLTDIIIELEKPSRDPRLTDEKPAFDDNVTSLDTLEVGQIVTGRVANVTTFGAFVDLGLKQNALIHISQLADGFVSSPFDIVNAGDIVRARIIDIDRDRGRIALSLKDVEQ